MTENSLKKYIFTIFVNMFTNICYSIVLNQQVNMKIFQKRLPNQQVVENKNISKMDIILKKKLFENDRSYMCKNFFCVNYTITAFSQVMKLGKTYNTFKY